MHGPLDNLWLDVELAPGWNCDAFTIPADCKAPELVFAIASLSSHGLNCKAVGGGDVDSLSICRCFTTSPIAGVLEAWHLDNRLGGMFMKYSSNKNKWRWWNEFDRLQAVNRNGIGRKRGQRKPRSLIYIPLNVWWVIGKFVSTQPLPPLL